ncbi:MAG: hypothetical protein ABIV50_06145, partial [Opitutus sp.]
PHLIQVLGNDPKPNHPSVPVTDAPRMRLYCGLLSGFFIGGSLGVLGYSRFGYDTLLFPATLAGVSGLGYAVFKHFELTVP